MVREADSGVPLTPAGCEPSPVSSQRLSPLCAGGAGAALALSRREGAEGAPPSLAPASYPVMRGAGMLSSRCLPLLSQQQCLQQ